MSTKIRIIAVKLLNLHHYLTIVDCSCSYETKETKTQVCCYILSLLVCLLSHSG